MKSYTLLELLVVIALMALLSMILFPQICDNDQAQDANVTMQM